MSGFHFFKTNKILLLRRQNSIGIVGNTKTGYGVYKKGQTFAQKTWRLDFPW
jgi:urease beta subunit